MTSSALGRAGGGCPYRGLAAYVEEDARLFFGRRRDSRIVSSNLVAARLTILYAPSGVGKSSLVRAGVAHQLHADPDQALVVFDAWSGDPVLGLKSAVQRELTRLSRGLTPGALDASLDELFVAAAKESTGDLLVVLDQFEEYFDYPASSDVARSFEEQLARAVNRRDCPVHVLLVLREDALARLDRFSRRIPTLFNNYLRLERLTRSAATEAMKRPLEVYNSEHPPAAHATIDDELVELLLREVQAGQAPMLRAGREDDSRRAVRQPSEAEDLRVEAPYLQLVLTRVWDVALAQGPPVVLSAAALATLGGAGQILQTYVSSQMNKLSDDDRAVAARVFHFLITPTGTTSAYSAADLAEYAEVPLREVKPVLDSLAAADVRILRSVSSGPADTSTRYEIFFDVLAAAVSSWRSRYIALPAFRWATLGLPLAILAVVAALTEMALPPPNLLLLLTRGAVLVTLSMLMLVQIYRWFLRYVSMTGFLSIRTYRSPVVGGALSVLLFLLWYVSTNVRDSEGNWEPLWLQSVTTIRFVTYLFTVIVSWAVGALVFTAMQVGGQVAARRFKSFDAGLYAVFLVVSAAILGAIALTIRVPGLRWIAFGR